MKQEEPSISFQSEDVDFELPSPDVLSEWIEAVAKQEGADLIQINYVFCSDEYLLKLNQQYLQHDTYTDIITFPYAEPPIVEGDIFISIDRVKDNARQFEEPFERELHRVMIHGVLHLYGYPDKSAEEKKRMRQKEDGALAWLEARLDC